MTGIFLSSQIQEYYNFRNLFLALFAIFLIIGIIYGVRIHIIRIMQKHFGIEKRREIAQMQKNGRSVRRNTGVPQRNTGISQRNTGVPQRNTGIPQGYAAKMQTNAAEAIPAVPETVVLENTEETVVLNQVEETVVLSQENETGFRKQKDLIIVHGEDIF